MKQVQVRKRRQRKAEQQDAPTTNKKIARIWFS